MKKITEKSFINKQGESIFIDTTPENIPIFLRGKSFKYSRSINISPVLKSLTFEIIGKVSDIFYAKDSISFVDEIGTREELECFFKEGIFEMIS